MQKSKILVYVMIDYNHCDGLVRFNTMNDDKYYFDEDEYAVRANRSGKKFTLGDKFR